MLYLIATPIGNLKDITFRAVETLKTCDFILCEDTRVSINLLKRYEIKVPLKSYHQFNEASRENELIEEIKNGKTIGLISDAGTPVISDPGYRLVKRCREQGLPVTSLPGACAAITALSGSGLTSNKFQFVGFLPKKQGQLKETLIDAILYEGTTIGYESPHRLIATLEAICKINEKTIIAVGRELTKMFEDYQAGSVQKILNHYKSSSPKGEIVLLIQGGGEENVWKSLSPEKLVSFFQEAFALSSKEALKLASKQAGLAKRELYKKFTNSS